MNPRNAGKKRSSLIGTRLGQYRISSLLGDGSQASVYLARDEALGRFAAVKVFKVLSKDLSALIHEARLIATLSHRNIIQVYAVDVTSPVPFMAMEYAPMLVHQKVSQAGPLDLKSAMRFTRHAAAALTHAHARSVIHRDVKPSNMLIAKGSELKLADFGLAARPNVQSSGLVGTPHYMAPEVWRGEGATEVSDVYGLGCCLYFMLTARPPFDSRSYGALRTSHLEDMPAVPEHVPSAVRELMLQMLSKDPSARPQTAAELVDRIWKLQDSSPDSIPAVGSDPARGDDGNFSQRVARSLVSQGHFASAAKALSSALLDNTPLLGLAGPAWRMQPFLLNRFLEQNADRTFVVARISVDDEELLSHFIDSFTPGERGRPSVYDTIANRISSGRQNAIVSVVQLMIRRRLAGQEVSDLVELTRRLSGQRVVIQVACDASVQSQLAEGFVASGLTNLTRWLAVDPMPLTEAREFVDEWLQMMPEGHPPWAPSSKLLLASMVRDQPESAPRVVHNITACAQFLGVPFVTTFTCRAGASHPGFINKSGDVDPVWATPPSQWPDEETRHQLLAIRDELETLTAGP